MEIQYGHYIRVRYHGPTDTRGSRLSATWEGWPSEGSNPVKRYLPYMSDRDAMAREVAEMFCAWLSDGGFDLTYTADRVTIAGASAADWALIVSTQAQPRA